MKNNPRDWSIETLKTLAAKKGWHCRHQGTSHVVFVRQDGQPLSVPARRPIKPVYILQFLEFIGE